MNEYDKRVIDDFMKEKGWTVLSYSDPVLIEDDDRLAPKGEACGSIGAWILEKIVADHDRRLEDMEEYD